MGAGGGGGGGEFTERKGEKAEVKCRGRKKRKKKQEKKGSNWIFYEVGKKRWLGSKFPSPLLELRKSSVSLQLNSKMNVAILLFIEL